MLPYKIWNETVLILRHRHMSTFILFYFILEKLYTVTVTVGSLDLFSNKLVMAAYNCNAVNV